jgi:hypothetical protein
MCLCHHCDNRRCCNPSHLFVGTREDNIYDATVKGRMTGPIPKINDFQVRIIKRLLKFRTLKQFQIAHVFEISEATVSNIKNNRRVRYNKI